MGFKSVSLITVNSKNVIFVRVPRNASRSLGLALGMERDKPQLSPSECIAAIGRRKWNDAFTVAFTRHPLSRIASWYKYYKNSMGVIHDDWRTWIRKGMPIHGDWAHKPYPLSQLSWLETVSFIGKVETMKDSWHELNKKLGTSLPFPARVNKSEESSVVEWSDDLRNLLPAWVQNECRLLGYDFYAYDELFNPLQPLQ